MGIGPGEVKLPLYGVLGMYSFCLILTSTLGILASVIWVGLFCSMWITY